VTPNISSSHRVSSSLAFTSPPLNTTTAVQSTRSSIACEGKFCPADLYLNDGYLEFMQDSCSHGDTVTLTHGFNPVWNMVATRRTDLLNVPWLPCSTRETTTQCTDTLWIHYVHSLLVLF
jgi:hypothetical protein